MKKLQMLWLVLFFIAFLFEHLFIAYASLFICGFLLLVEQSKKGGQP